ncbi:hypothetical protein I3843_04G112700 [Carya illinoinensis]|nr:hypothetical protein I3843_04G112700 [Carya illinoinensis]
MKKNENEQGAEVMLSKPRRPRSREVSSRFLSPTSVITSQETTGLPSPNSQSFSPIRRKPNASTNTNPRRQRSLEESGILHGLWPSLATSSSSSSSSSKSTKSSGTLADHIGNERLKDEKNEKKTAKGPDGPFLGRQTSCSEFSRFETEKEISTKENHRPSLGGSMRYTGKLAFPGKSSHHSSSLNSSSKTSGIFPGRLSIDENEMFRKTFGNSDSFTNTLEVDPECCDMGSGVAFCSPAIGKGSERSRKFDTEVYSRYMKDISAMRVSDLNIPNPVSSDNFPGPNKFTIRNAIKRVNSFTGAKSQWALSPGRSGSPPLMSVESKGKSMPFSSLKPPSSPSRATGVEKLLNMGLDLLKRKKSSSSSSLSMQPGNLENVHQLRLLYNRLLLWRYANARAEAVNGSITIQAERKFICAWDALTKLQHSVAEKKLQLEKEKLDMKLNNILSSQIKLLEAWGDMERPHISAVSRTVECLHAVVSRVPLTDGSSLDIKLAKITVGRALDLTTSIKSICTNLAPSAGNTVTLLSELAEVVAQENLLLEECLELLRTTSTLELQERSLKCSIIQLELWRQQQQQQQQKQEEIPLYILEV